MDYLISSKFEWRRNKRLLLITIVVVLAFCCRTRTAEWMTHDFGAFKLSTPYNWSKFDADGVDAYVGGLTNGKDSLWFYYGSYISETGYDEAENILYANDTINGHNAVIAIPKQMGKGSLELFIPNVPERYHFALRGYDIKDVGTILQIFKTVRFKNSDTTKNGVLTAKKFKGYPSGSGRALYLSLCSSCHSVNKNTIGTGLKGVLEGQSPEWLNNFLKDKNPIIRENSIINRKHKNITLFDKLNKEDVKRIFWYVQAS